MKAIWQPHRLFHSLFTQARQTELPAVRAEQDTVSGIWKTVGIPTCRVITQCIATHTESTALQMHPDQFLYMPFTHLVIPTNIIHRTVP